MIGLGSYAFFWRHSDRMSHPLTLEDELRQTRDLGVELFQICDYAPLTTMSDGELRHAASVARDLGVTVQLGTKGVAPDHLARFLALAEVFDARLIRSMLFSDDSRPTLPEAERMLRSSLPAFAEAGVTLALETYEQVPSADLVALVEAIGSDHLGICLDPANTVAALEDPRAVVERCAPLTRNLHVKDFAFSRQAGWVGFTLAGAPLGEGLLDYEHLMTTVDPDARGVDRIVEHWLPWQGDPETTARVEADWTSHNLHRMRSIT